MELLEAKKIMDEKLGDYKIMALASCVDDYPMVRNVSCVFYNDKIYFKTDKNFRKTQQLFKNDKVAMCFNGVQGRIFEKKYKEFLWQSYNAYSHIDTEILIEVTPKFVEIWDEDENRNAFQLFIDFDKETVEYKPYD